MTDSVFMQIAIQQAQIAFEEGEIPVGAVLVHQNRVIAKSHNQTELLHDVTAHAEILAISAASSNMQSKYLRQCTLYITLEPCAMCAAAINWAQIGRIVYAASDIKKGFSMYQPNLLHPKTEVSFGILADKSESLLDVFFQKLRTIKH